MALQLLNISVDSPDPYPTHIPENLAINDQESMLEIVIEQFMGYDNAIEEYDDNDMENNSKRTSASIELFSSYAMYTALAQLPPRAIKTSFPQLTAHKISGYHRITTPPPEA
jgi:hypothetical protein